MVFVKKMIRTLTALDRIFQNMATSQRRQGQTRLPESNGEVIAATKPAVSTKAEPDIVEDY